MKEPKFVLSPRKGHVYRAHRDFACACVPCGRAIRKYDEIVTSATEMEYWVHRGCFSETSTNILDTINPLCLTVYVPKISLYDKPPDYEAPVDDFTAMRELCDNCGYDYGSHRSKDNACPVWAQYQYLANSSFCGTGKFRYSQVDSTADTFSVKAPRPSIERVNG